MKISRYFSIALVFLILQSCGSKMTEAELLSEQVAFNQLQELITSKLFCFSAEAAFPMQSNDIAEVTNALLSQIGSNGVRQQLSANDDFLIIKGDSITCNLSYFGELRTSNYNDSRDNNIQFNGKPYTFTTTKNDKKNLITVKFKIKGDDEDFNINMVVFPNKTSKVTVYGANRTAIRYEGIIKALDE